MGLDFKLLFYSKISSAIHLAEHSLVQGQRDATPGEDRTYSNDYGLQNYFLANDQYISK